MARKVWAIRTKTHKIYIPEQVEVVDNDLQQGQILKQTSRAPRIPEEILKSLIDQLWSLIELTALIKSFKTNTLSTWTAIFIGTKLQSCK